MASHTTEYGEPRGVAGYIVHFTVTTFSGSLARSLDVYANDNGQLVLLTDESLDEIPNDTEIEALINQACDDGKLRRLAPSPADVYAGLAPTFTVRVPDASWEENDGMDDPSDRLRVTLMVNGRYPMHFEAWAVTYDDNEMVQHLPDHDDDLDLFATAVGSDGSFQTISIRGREYILLASPFCN
jgi:hypothetical protein